MRFGLYFLFSIGLIVAAYHAAQNSMQRPLNLSAIRLGMNMEEIKDAFGNPSARMRNQYTYILEDGSELTFTLRDKKLSSATVKFHRSIAIADPEMRKLSLVQMDDRKTEDNRHSWFFAGNPEEGLIYKITSEGKIESLTWVPPFTYGGNRPKHLQALFRDFHSQQLTNL